MELNKLLNNIFNVLLPISYVWITPLLAKIGFCNNTKGSFGNSLSNYINTPQATGGMAVSYYSISNIMISKRFYKVGIPDNGIFYMSGIFYEICFGIFLCCPVDYSTIIHCVSVSGFIAGAYIHIIYLEYSPYFKQKWSLSLKILKFIGNLSIIGLLITFTLVNFIQIPNNLFWIFECTGLTTLILIMNIAHDICAESPIETFNGILV